jgi:hypothetical protein
MVKTAEIGFESLEEAAKVVNAYNSRDDKEMKSIGEQRHRLEGLRKNLRLRNGRYYWYIGYSSSFGVVVLEWNRASPFHVSLTIGTGIRISCDVMTKPRLIWILLKAL